MKIVVTIREFTRNIYKYLTAGGFYTITVNGKDSFTVMISRLLPGTAAQIVTTPIVTTIPQKDNFKDKDGIRSVIINMPGKYACGCKRGETKLCSKHHRA